MLSFDVSSQVDLALEGSGADVTRERLESRMLPTVCYEVRRLAERLTTLTTHVRLLPCDVQMKQLAIMAEHCYNASSVSELSLL